MKTKEKKYKKEDCDKLLTPIIKQLFPQCMLCGANTQVAHHMFHKSKSMILRYNLKNLIPLCNGCHFKLHFDEGQWSGKIIVIKGIKWFKQLAKINETKVKLNFNEIYKLLSKIK